MCGGCMPAKGSFTKKEREKKEFVGNTVLPKKVNSKVYLVSFS